MTETVGFGEVLGKNSSAPLKLWQTVAIEIRSLFTWYLLYTEPQTTAKKSITRRAMKNPIVGWV